MSASIASSEDRASKPRTSVSNPADPAPRLDSSDWRQTLLPRLQGLPLLPIGAGAKGKAPINPTNGRPMGGWQEAAFTPAQIGGMPGCVTAVGTRCGHDAGGLVIFDVDGEAALKLVAAAGCQPFTDETWSIFRSTAADRLKVVWQVAPEQWAERTLQTVTQKTADGGEIRAIWQTGQAIVAGWHKESDSYLEWSGGPEAIAPLPDAWLALWRSLKADEGEPGTTTRKRSSKGDWKPAVPCPICGRTKDLDCQVHREGVAVLCHHGSTHAPPMGMRRGDRIPGTEWAYCRDGSNAIGTWSLFRQHQPRERPPLRVLPDPTRTVQDHPGPSAAAVLDDPGPSEPALGDLFPPALAGALQARCRYLPADPASIAVTFLAAAAGAVKNGTRVIGAEAAGYAVPANHYGAVVAPSGAKKTPLGTLLIHDTTTGIRADLRRLQEQEQQAWQEQQQQEQGGKGKRRQATDPPRPRMFSASEMTGEALAVQLVVQEQHGLGLLIHRDEIAGLIGGLNQYRGGRGADHQQLLEAFDGRGGAALRVKSDGLRSFERCQLAIYGGIQPGVLRKLVEAGDDSGLWARFLFAPLPARVVPLPPDDPEQTAISATAAAALREAIENLYRLPPHQYRLTADAGDRFRRFEQEQQERVHAADVDAVSALAGKAAGKVLRIAGLLHLLAIATGEAAHGSEVTLERIGGAIALVTWCHDWTAGIHEAAAAGDDLDAAALVLELAKGRPVSWKDLYHRLSHRQRQVLGGAAGFAAVARQLEADGRGGITTGPRGGLRFKAG